MKRKGTLLSPKDTDFPNSENVNYKANLQSPLKLTGYIGRIATALSRSEQEKPRMMKTNKTKKSLKHATAQDKEKNSKSVAYHVPE